MEQKYNFVHSCIRVMDLKKAIDFYQKAFSFEVSQRRDFPEDKFTLVYLKGAGSDFELELTYNYDREQPYTIGDGYSHIAVTVDDLQKSYKRHQEMGYKVSDITSLSEDSRGFYFITDPDGYEIEVIH